jgi:hypothetical protein
MVGILFVSCLLFVVCCLWFVVCGKLETIDSRAERLGYS